tara:strand:- start:3429 stop:3902 length:474 start_codon:yes stop_codon:yes gene_type:complete
MKNILKYFNFRSKSFESEFEKLTKQLVEVCFEYVKYDSKNVDEIYIYCSTECSTIWFDAFFRLNGSIVKRHKVGDKYEITDQKQLSLVKVSNKIIQQLIDNFKKYSKEVPTEIKIVYTIDGGKFDCNLTYETIWENNPDKDPHMICDEWMELQKTES